MLERHQASPVSSRSPYLPVSDIIKTRGRCRTGRKWQQIDRVHQESPVVRVHPSVEIACSIRVYLVRMVQIEKVSNLVGRIISQFMDQIRARGRPRIESATVEIAVDTHHDT